MIIFVRTPHGRALRLEVDSITTIAQLKALVASKSRYSESEQRILNGTKELKDGWMLAACGISNNSTLNLKSIKWPKGSEGLEAGNAGAATATGSMSPSNWEASLRSPAKKSPRPRSTTPSKDVLYQQQQQQQQPTLVQSITELHQQQLEMQSRLEEQMYQQRQQKLKTERQQLESEMYYNEEAMQYQRSPQSPQIYDVRRLQEELKKALFEKSRALLQKNELEGRLLERNEGFEALTSRLPLLEQSFIAVEKQLRETQLRHEQSKGVLDNKIAELEQTKQKMEEQQLLLNELQHQLAAALTETKRVRDENIKLRIELDTLETNLRNNDDTAAVSIQNEQLRIQIQELHQQNQFLRNEKDALESNMQRQEEIHKEKLQILESEVAFHRELAKKSQQARDIISEAKRSASPPQSRRLSAVSVATTSEPLALDDSSIPKQLFHAAEKFSDYYLNNNNGSNRSNYRGEMAAAVPTSSSSSIVSQHQQSQQQSRIYGRGADAKSLSSAYATPDRSLAIKAKWEEEKAQIQKLANDASVARDRLAEEMRHLSVKERGSSSSSWSNRGYSYNDSNNNNSSSSGVNRFGTSAEVMGLEDRDRSESASSRTNAAIIKLRDEALNASAKREKLLFSRIDGWNAPLPDDITGWK